MSNFCGECGTQLKSNKKDRKIKIVDSCVNYEEDITWRTTAFEGKGYVQVDGFEDSAVELLDSPSYRKVYNAAERLTNKVNDAHHVYFEGFYKTDRKIKGHPVYDISMGS